MDKKVISLFDIKARQETNELIKRAQETEEQLFEDAVRRNERNKKRMQRERLEKNKKTLKDYRIK